MKDGDGALSRREFIKLGAAGAAMLLADWRLWAEGEGLPAYYGDYLAGIAARLERLSKTCDDSFFFITDLHIPANRRMSGRILAKLVAETSVKKVLCGGDMPEAFGGRASVERTIAEYRRDWVEAVESVGGEFYAAKGNHDFTIRDKPGAAGGWTLSGKAAHDILTDTAATKKNAVTDAGNPEACYYYFDSPKARIRYIVADTSDSIRTDRTYWAVNYSMGERQLKWLAKNALATMPDGWLALVMHHIPVARIPSGEKETPTTFAPWRRILEACQSRGKADVCGETVDFGKARGRILCSLTGHEHAERQTFLNGVWHITEPCDAAYSDYIIGSAPWCSGLPRKEKGTVNEQTFEAVHIDRRNRVLHFTRIGGGANRIVCLEPVVAKVGVPMPFAPPTPAATGAAWRCYDADWMGKERNPANKYQYFCKYRNDIAEFDAEGSLTGKKPGEAVALATSADGCRLLVPVVVK